jgi:hypothetical protein
LYKFKTKRYEASTGLASVAARNSLRGYEILANDINIGSINNVSGSHWSKDDSNQWYISFTAKPKNVTLSKRFEFDDVKQAIDFAKMAFTEIMKSTPEDEKLYKMKKSILDLGRIEDPNDAITESKSYEDIPNDGSVWTLIVKINPKNINRLINYIYNNKIHVVIDREKSNNINEYRITNVNYDRLQNMKSIPFKILKTTKGNDH